MTWRTSTTLRLAGLGFLVLGAIFPQRVFFYIGAGLLIAGWLLLFRERRTLFRARRAPGPERRPPDRS